MGTHSIHVVFKISYKLLPNDVIRIPISGPGIPVQLLMVHDMLSVHPLILALITIREGTGPNVLCSLSDYAKYLVFAVELFATALPQYCGEKDNIVYGFCVLFNYVGE